MSRLVIGHVTQRSATIWIRGSREHSYGFVEIDGPGGKKTKTVSLEDRHFFTGVATFTGLRANAEYACAVSFGSERRTPELLRVDFGHCRGRFRTFPAESRPRPMTFLFGSCNLHSLGPLVLPANPAFERLTEVAAGSDADFMIHCGDQIYYDVPDWWKAPSVDEYRDKYLDAWGDSRAARKFLTRLPQYMILDDHELVNNFSNDMDSRKYGAPPVRIRDIALKVYREFVQIRQPDPFGNQALYYTFAHGRNRFFVLDVRSERWAYPDAGRSPRMIGDSQMRALKLWLTKYATDPKFVVTSVPFVTDVKTDDKWSAAAYRPQRDEIIDHLARHEIRGVTFLTGDMHNSYHATMDIGPAGEELRVHELMSSPINQIGKRTLDAYDQGNVHRTSTGTAYRSRIHRFYDQHSNAMTVTVEGRKVSWTIFRTKRRQKARSGAFEV